MHETFTQIVKDALFSREDFEGLIEEYNVRDVREVLLELRASLTAQLQSRWAEAGSDWYSRTSTLKTFVERRLDTVTQAIDGHRNTLIKGWEDLTLDLLDILDENGVVGEAHDLTVPSGEWVLDWRMKRA